MKTEDTKTINNSISSKEGEVKKGFEEKPFKIPSVFDIWLEKMIRGKNLIYQDFNFSRYRSLYALDIAAIQRINEVLKR